ncbi:MAG: N-methyl-D-aspartate receptor NMDAR2C subunit [Verrucomicrobiales bacterium]|nr:N-methyl-D-aspartate receptor NMDAR2C subunit [Verrucomicrobiales bacterium]|tara:strand:- start:820 stop:1455 length:636 start_codon:yes stop_codon:yes gene_type:complete
MIDLPSRWKETCTGLPDSLVSEAFERLRGLYDQPPRAYHNLSHIAACLAEFDHVRGKVNDPTPIELAIWYHDCVYDFQAKGNEERSAEKARKELEPLGFDSATIEEAVKLILKTRHGIDLPETPDEKTMVDIDLSILGKSPEVFDRFERQIREEYSWVLDAQFAAGRAAVLKTFLDRERVYETEFFHDRYEAHARENLKRSIASLTAKTSE